VLDDRHFLFRGGADRDATLRTRAGDHSRFATQLNTVQRVRRPEAEA